MKHCACEAFLLRKVDEDTCATNFMIRDEKMKAKRENESVDL